MQGRRGARLEDTCEACWEARPWRPRHAALGWILVGAALLFDTVCMCVSIYIYICNTIYIYVIIGHSRTQCTITSWNACIYLCVCIHMVTHTITHVLTRVYVYIYMYMGVYIYIHTHMYVCARKCAERERENKQNDRERGGLDRKIQSQRQNDRQRSSNKKHKMTGRYVAAFKPQQIACSFSERSFWTQRWFPSNFLVRRSIYTCYRFWIVEAAKSSKTQNKDPHASSPWC